MAHHQPISIPEFFRRFNSEKACREYLFQLRWPKGFQCPKCNHDQYYFVEGRNLYQCTNCRYQASVTAGTIMHKTRTPLFIWFWMIFMLSRDKRGYSALAITRFCDVSYYCAFNILRKVRKAMGNRDARYALVNIIQLDDAYFGGASAGKESGKRGRGTGKTSVLVAVSTDEEGKPKHLKIQVLEDLTQQEINRLSSRMFQKGSVVRTDKLPSYLGLSKVGFKHDNEVLSGVYDVNVEPFHWVHIVISNAKAALIGTYHGVSPKYLQLYLDEYCYRFSRRFMGSEIFVRAIVACVNCLPVTVAELTA